MEKLISRPAKPPEEWGKIERSNAVEKWGRMREQTVQHFKFTPRTTTYCLIWAFLVPYGVLSVIKWERRRRDRMKGRPIQPLL